MRVGPRWADAHIAALARGEAVEFRPRGRSMEPKIMDGDLVRIVPVPDGEALNVGDIVLVDVEGRQYLHQILDAPISGEGTAIGPKQTELLIGNNRGGVNGWVTRDKIFGRRAP